jgi:hypothetical protein
VLNYLDELIHHTMAMVVPLSLSSQVPAVSRTHLLMVLNPCARCDSTTKSCIGGQLTIAGLAWLGSAGLAWLGLVYCFFLDKQPETTETNQNQLTNAGVLLV